MASHGIVLHIDPDEDAATAALLIDSFVRFVANGPYLHVENNSCWFCDRGIGPFEIAEQGDAGHHERCIYLKAWRLLNPLCYTPAKGSA